jgi:hypothetical protein
MNEIPDGFLRPQRITWSIYRCIDGMECVVKSELRHIGRNGDGRGNLTYITHFAKLNLLGLSAVLR